MKKILSLLILSLLLASVFASADNFQTKRRFLQDEQPAEEQPAEENAGKPCTDDERNAEVCTDDFTPVCAFEKTENGYNKVTKSNRCSACSDKTTLFEYTIDGECENQNPGEEQPTEEQPTEEQPAEENAGKPCTDDERNAEVCTDDFTPVCAFEKTENGYNKVTKSNRCSACSDKTTLFEYTIDGECENQNPGEENPGEENPGEENPGEENPGEENPGEENPGEENPGENNQNNNNSTKSGSDYNSTNSTQFLDVFGRAKGKANLGNAKIGFTLVTVDSSAHSAISNNTLKYNNTIEALKSLGLEDKNFEISSQQVFTLKVPIQQEGQEENSEEQEFSWAFRVVHSFSLWAKSELAGDILDKALSNGVEQIDYINYLPSEEDIEALREELLEKAIDNSQKWARKAVEKLGYELGPIMDIKFLNEDEWDFDRINELAKANGMLPDFEQLVEVKYGMRIKEEKAEEENPGEENNLCTEEERNADACTEIYQPVCAYEKTENGYNKVTKSNRCSACSDKTTLFEYTVDGECKNEEQPTEENNLCTEEERNADACTEIYQPVCAYEKTENGYNKVTKSNRCSACSDKTTLFEYTVDGECKNEEQPTEENAGQQCTDDERNADACLDVYEPVCAFQKTENGYNKVTKSNRCYACSDKNTLFEYTVDGECENSNPPEEQPTEELPSEEQPAEEQPAQP